MFVGFGTLVNVAAVILGSGLGLTAGSKISDQTKETITATLAIFTIVIGGFSLTAMESDNLRAEAGQFTAIVVLLALLLGAFIGSWLRIESRLEQGAEWIKSRYIANSTSATFVTGWITATLVSCVGPLAIVGSISEGLGQGPQQLLVKSVLDGFTALAFASTMGWGVMLSAASVAVVQGSLTLLGYFAGSFLTFGQIDALSATGGVILIALGIRLLAVKDIRIGDMLPALALAPLGVWIVSSFIS